MRKRGQGSRSQGGSAHGKLAGGGSPSVAAVQSCTLSVACSDTVLRVCVALEKGVRGRERARALVNCERENQMTGDNCFNALLLLNKSALQVGRKDFFFLVVICLRELENGELSGWMINGGKITFR